jgi:hypothetical protein
MAYDHGQLAQGTRRTNVWRYETFEYLVTSIINNDDLNIMPLIEEQRVGRLARELQQALQEISDKRSKTRKVGPSIRTFAVWQGSTNLSRLIHRVLITLMMELRFCRSGWVPTAF